MTSPTSPRNAGPQFSNPFGRQRQGSDDKVPSLATVTPYQPLLTDPNEADETTPTPASGPSPPTSTGWRNRAASLFQSISSSSSDRSDRSAANLNNGIGPGAIQLKTDLQRERNPSVAAARRPSYVPKYAAAAHMASMSGRSSVVGSKLEAEERLRRDSRMASVAFAKDQSLPGLNEAMSPIAAGDD